MSKENKIYEKYMKEYDNMKKQYENYKLNSLDGWKVYTNKRIKDDNIYVIDNNKYKDYTEVGSWVKESESILGNSEDLKRLMDLIEKQKNDTTTVGTLKIRDGKLILEHGMKEIVMCDLEDENAAASIMAAIAKIQLEEMSNAKQ